MTHMSVDNDEKLEKTCEKCKTGMDDKKCIQCGGKMEINNESNPQFDDSIFEKMKQQAT